MRPVKLPLIKSSSDTQLTLSPKHFVAFEVKILVIESGFQEGFIVDLVECSRF